MRQIPSVLKAAFDSPMRRPALKVYAWDPSTITISQLVSATSNHTDELPDPLDLTPYISDITWSNTQLAFTLTDPADWFHPDTGQYRGYLKDAAIIRLVEGDEAVPNEEFWINTFTGQIHGQVGWKKNRKDPLMEATITAYDRGQTQSFKRRLITSTQYTVGTDIGIALSDIILTFMGMTAAESRVPPVIGRQFQHQVNQLCQVAPWDAISAILEVVCDIPFFDGDGRLAYINMNLQRSPDKILTDYDEFAEFEVPENNQDAVNEVTVTFLDAELERVDSYVQKLGDAQVTTGFFSMHEKLPCWWSDDHSQRADSTYMKVIKSVNSGLLPVGTERYTQEDLFHGQIDVDISVWVPILATVMIMEYLAAALIPDKTAPISSANLEPIPVIVAPGGGAGTIAPGTCLVSQLTPTPVAGFTIPWGRIIQAQASAGIMLIMMSMGSAQYEIWGTPFDFAYLEKQSIAIVDGLDYWLENNLDIKNDFIGSFDQADVVSMTNLIWQQSQSLPRRITIKDDPTLEPGDIVALPDGRQIVINTLQKRIQRGEISSVIIDGGKVLTP